MADNPLSSWAAWSRGERNAVGGAFEAVLGRPLADRGFVGAVGQGFGAGARLGAMGLWKMAQFAGTAAFTGGANLATGAWSMIPGASPTWWKRRETTTLNRQIADWNPKTGSFAAWEGLDARYTQLTGEELTTTRRAQIDKAYGRSGEGLHAFGGARPFGQRGVRGHLWQGGKTYLRHGLLSPLSLGLNTAFSLYESDNNLLDPKSGMAKHMLGFMGMEAGFMLGGTMGAATASAMVPTGGALAAGAGYMLGAIAGSLVAGYATGQGLVDLAQMGQKYGRYRKPHRTKFLDSEGAATMRQRALRAVHRSQMNARSAFGHEAMAYHA